MVAQIIPVEPLDFVVFGGTGDLSRRKLLPGLYHRIRAGQMPAEAGIIGVARSDLDDASFRNLARESLEQFVAEADLDRGTLAAFLDCLSYARVDVADADGSTALAKKLGDGMGPVRTFYLSVAPQLFGPICEQLSAARLATAGCRLVVEKPAHFSGASGKVPAAIHVSPEAVEGGPLARLRDGNRVRLDAESGILEMLVSAAEWSARPWLCEHRTGDLP